MADQVVPNTDNYGVACMAVAWEIVRLTTLHDQPDDRKIRRDNLTNDVIAVYQAILNLQPIEGNNAG